MKIPQGKECKGCSLFHYNLIDDCPDYQCDLFLKSWSKDDSKIKECLGKFPEKVKK